MVSLVEVVEAFKHPENSHDDKQLSIDILNEDRSINFY